MAAAPSPTRALETGGAGSQAYFYFKESPPYPHPLPTESGSWAPPLSAVNA